MHTLILGHRGYALKYPENTLLSFEKAFEAGCDGIELDIHFSKDGELMIFHDFDLSPLTGEKGLIFNYTKSELQSLLIGQNCHMPTLEEVLTLIQSLPTQKNILLNLELKAGSQMYPNIEEAVVETCYAFLNKEQCIFSSFDHHALVKIKSIDSNAKTGALTTAALYEPWNYLKSIQANYYHPHYLTLTETALKAFSAHKLPINTYTVNDLEIAKRLIKAGVYSIITDDVKSMVSLRNEVCHETRC